MPKKNHSTILMYLCGKVKGNYCKLWIQNGICCLCRKVPAHSYGPKSIRKTNPLKYLPIRRNSLKIVDFIIIDVIYQITFYSRSSILFSSFATISSSKLPYTKYCILHTTSTIVLGHKIFDLFNLFAKP